MSAHVKLLIFFLLLLLLSLVFRGASGSHTSAGLLARAENNINGRGRARVHTFEKCVSNSVNHKMNPSIDSTSRDNQKQLLKNKAWPPFPFNLLQLQRASPEDVPSSSISSTIPSGADIFFQYLRNRGKIGIRQVQSVASSLAIHLPPAAPPLVLLALMPVTRPDPQLAVTGILVPLHTFAQRAALTFLGISAISWAHCEFRKNKRLTPLPLKFNMALTTIDEWATVLPPFLPEQPVRPLMTTDCMQQQNQPERKIIENHKSNYTSSSLVAVGSPNQHTMQLFQKWQQQIFEKTKKAPRTFTATFQEWQRLRMLRQSERLDKKRRDIYEQLIAFQRIKGGKPWLGKGQIHADESVATSPLGWALVTGASKGIGRALAVELARWEIPLVLVARDIDRLKQLATEIKQCYGVPCCIVQADLAKPGVEASIHRATQEAGIDVDILVNNAGRSYCSALVDTDLDVLDSVMQLNSRVVTSLTRLYGKDMKDRRRGRILFVSSVTGSFPGVPGSAVYAATKAYQNSLATSLAKELEPHGVGVTCLMPGAVRGTDFGRESNMQNALCWKYPFYSRTTQEVASRGVRALLLGDTEVIPGLLNRLWLKICQPMLPQRISTIVAEVSWNPIHFSIPRFYMMENSLGREQIASSGAARLKIQHRASTPMILSLENLSAVDPKADGINDALHSSVPVFEFGNSQDSSSNATIAEQAEIKEPLKPPEDTTASIIEESIHEPVI